MRAGETVLALDTVDSAADGNNAAELNVSGSNFAPANPVVSITFVAPSSGLVWMVVGGGIRDNSSNNRGVMSFEIRQDSAGGDVIFWPGISRSGWSNSSETGGYQYGSRMIPVSGLEPGRTYFAQVMVQVNGGATVDFNNKQIFAIPA